MLQISFNKKFHHCMYVTVGGIFELHTCVCVCGVCMYLESAQRYKTLVSHPDFLETVCRWVGHYHYPLRVFKVDARIRNTFPMCICSAALPQAGRLLPKTGRLESEVFFRICERLLPKSAGLFVPKFLTNGPASLTDLPELRLGICSCIYKSRSQRDAFVSETRTK